MTADIEQAATFLLLLQPDDTPNYEFCWLTQAEAPGVEGHPRQTFATLPQAWPKLALQNSLGCRVYVGINEIEPTFDAKGRARRAAAVAPVLRVRAVFGDFDNPKVPLPAFDLAPSIIVQTSPGKHHAYWLTAEAEALPVAEFDQVQRGIITKYKASGADRSILAPNRMMRLPGSVHCKGEPRHLVSILEAPGHHYTAQELRAAFPYAAPARRAPGAAVTWDGVIPDDLVLVARWVAAVYPQRDDGSFNVDCPWGDLHTIDSGASATTWWPPSQKNNGRGGFHCQHSHCADRGADDYHRAIRAHILKATT